MDYIFLSIYDFFSGRRKTFYAVCITLGVLVIAGASQIHVEEDITKIFPNDRKAEKLTQVLQGSHFMEKMVVTISLKDTTREAQPDSLSAFAEDLVSNIRKYDSGHFSQIYYRVDDEFALSLIDELLNNIPLFLEKEDYVKLDSLTKPETIETTMQVDFRQLVSPSGIISKNMILKDPLGIANPILGKLRGLQYDENYTLYDNYIFTRDHKHLIFFLTAKFPPNDTGHNIEMINRLDEAIRNVSAHHPNMHASYFGSPAVSVGNALQLRKDTTLTLIIMVVMLLVLLVGFFRRKRIPLAILIPVLFGGLFSLSLIYLIQGTVSVIAIAAGSIVMGVAVDYSLHYFVHLKHTGNIRTVIRDLAKPLTLGSTTTVLAFLGLQFVNASLLRDMGLFAGFSLIGAALFSLIILPHFFPQDFLKPEKTSVESGIDKLTFSNKKVNAYLVAFIFILTPFFLYFARDVKFNSDMNKLNFMTPELQSAQAELNRINQFAFRSVFIVAEGNTEQEALQKNETVYPLLKSLEKEGLIKKISSVATFLPSDSLQKIRIETWNRYWTAEKRQQVILKLRQTAGSLGFKPNAFDPGIEILNKTYIPLSSIELEKIKAAFFDDHFSSEAGKNNVITFVQVNQKEKNILYDKLGSFSQVIAVDNELLTNMLVGYVNQDFNFILAFTSILVFAALLLSYGRIELTLITFIPMMITWIWILGIMALLKIEFNIVNVMISTFIFGLGDDYSIFIMDGLQQKYKSNKNNLSSFKTSIVLSAVTTISGLGVLIFAQHPALKSIALISIVGIVCVLIMSQTIEPFLFGFFITNRTKKRFPPITMWGLIKTVWAFAYYVFGAVLLTVVGYLILVIPFGKKKLKYFYHVSIQLCTGSLVYMMANVKKKIIKNKDQFKEPSIIIANHSSFIDILATAMLHPKVILLTNRWVWNSPVFGRVVRFADYYPVMEGAEQGIDKLAAKIKEGFSVIIFPEGTRSYDGKIQRFHKGAFYLSEELQVPITPLIIHGMNNTIMKGDFYLQDASFTMKFMPTISPDDAAFGTGYRERTKKISKYFKAEFNKLAKERETPEFFRYKLISNFLYKGPILEWYLRIKLKLENNYHVFAEIVPGSCSVLDLGCGYGFLCYMLQFLSGERNITGIDYDEDKIETANNCYSKTERLNFVCADIVEYPLSTYDVIIISDVLHYLSPEQQEKVLNKSFQALNPGGRIILREGITDGGKRYRGTKLSEFFSVRVLRFNKSVQSLNFISGEMIRNEAEKQNFEVEVIDNAKLTSNVIFVLKKPGNGE